MRDPTIYTDRDCVDPGETLAVTIETGSDGIELRDSRPYLVYRKSDAGEWKAVTNQGGLMSTVPMEGGQTETYEVTVCSTPGQYKVSLNAFDSNAEDTFRVVDS